MSFQAAVGVYALATISAVMMSRYHRKTEYWYIGILGMVLSGSLIIFLVVKMLYT